MPPVVGVRYQSSLPRYLRKRLHRRHCCETRVNEGISLLNELAFQSVHGASGRQSAATTHKLGATQCAVISRVRAA
eukprot:10045059-Karenia_brevis.AAC.1